MLDSLKAREDWYRQNQIWMEQYVLAQVHITRLDSTIGANNEKCDTTVNAMLADQKELIEEVDNLSDAASRTPLVVVLFSLIFFVAGVVIAQ